MKTATSTHRGAALILALAALLILTSACVAVAGIASRVKVSRQVNEQLLAAEDLLRAAEAPILEWLLRESATIVLSPEADAPEVHVLHDAWLHDGTHYELRIVAWDQLGMVSIAGARAGSPLRLALPPHALERIDSPDVSHGEQSLGLDVFSRPFDPDSTGPFPRPRQSEAIQWTGPREASSLPTRQEHEPLALGALVATHHQPTAHGMGVVNINTAPLPLVEHALRLAGRGGIEMIVTARSAGKQVNIGALGPAGSGGSGAAAPVIVAASSVWAFRVDARVGSVQRSTWIIYERAAGRNTGRTTTRSQNQGWEVVQSIAIRD